MSEIQSFYSTRIDATGSRGNIYAVLGTALGFLRQLGVSELERTSFAKHVRAATSYEEALDRVRELFPVDTD